MGFCHFIFSFLAAAAVLAGAVLNWIAIDQEGSAEYVGTTHVNTYSRMAFRYEAAGVFFIGLLVLFQAFFHNKFEGMSRMFTYVIVGLGFYSLVLNTNYNGTKSMHLDAAGTKFFSFRDFTGRYQAVFINELRIFYQGNKDISAADATGADVNRYMFNYEKMYLGGGFLAYAGFILAIMSQSSPGFKAHNGCFSVFRVISVIFLTALAIIGIFLVSASHSTDFPDFAAVNDHTKAVYSSNVTVVAATFYIWLVAFNSLLSGNRELSGGSGVLFGIYGFYFLMKLLAINDSLTTLHDTAYISDKDYKQTRAGYLFAWFTGIFAFISNSFVFAYSADGTVSA